MVTRLYSHPACLTHDMGAGHPESPARLTSILVALKAPEFAALEWAEAPRASFEQVMRAHPPAFIEGVLAAVPDSGRVALDADTILSPGTGEVEETGVGNICNAPLRPNAGSAEFRAAMTDRVLPALDAFKPDFLLISAGFDAHKADPLASLQLEEADYAWATDQLLAVATRRCQGRVVSALEGGYDLGALAASSAAHVRRLMAAAGGNSLP